jgi:DNA-binding transcriptional LysR family regulator
MHAKAQVNKLWKRPFCLYTPGKEVVCVQELQDIYRLQALVAVIEEGSLSAAVGRLHITQPALSARLKLLEESLGCMLLERTGRGVRPTPLGKLVYGISVDILSRMRHLQTTVQNHIELREGWVHLGGGATAVNGVFPESIARFRHTHPNIQFTLHEQDSHAVIEAVRDGAVDVGLVTQHHNPTSGPPSSNFADDPALAGLQVHGKLCDSLVVIASSKHPIVQMSQSLQKVQKSLLPMHLNKLPLILFEEGSAIRQIIDVEFRRCYIHPKVVMTLRSTQSMLRMVQKGIGLSVVSRLSLNLPEPDVEIIQVEGLTMQRWLLLVSSAERSLPPGPMAFLAEMMTAFAGVPVAIP